MKVKVIKKFKDKNTKEIREVGSVFEVDEKRLAEIQSVDKFVEVCEVAQDKKAKK